MKFLSTVSLIIVALLFSVGFAAAQDSMTHSTGAFSGVKVNGGTATHSVKDGQNILTLSEDFVHPKTPDPHWQVVDSKGNIYQLQKLEIKGGKFNNSIVVPKYVPDIAKVQIWCAFAETLLGEASFSQTVMLK